MYKKVKIGFGTEEDIMNLAIQMAMIENPNANEVELRRAILDFKKHSNENGS